MKFFFTAYILCCLPVLGLSQNWQSLPGEIGDESIYVMYHDTVTHQVYVGGDFYVIDGDSTIRSIASWDGSLWHSLTSGLDLYDFNASVRAIIRFQGDIYVGGYLNGAHNGVDCKGIARWDGNLWHDVGGGVLDPFGDEGVVSGFSIINNELYVSGKFSTAGGLSANGLAKWNGTAWQGVHDFHLFNTDNDFVKAAALYNGELYIGGGFARDNGRVGIVKWDGNSWTAVGNGVGPIITLEVYKNKLYAAGEFSKAMNPAFPGYHIAAWNGIEWNDVGGGVRGENGIGMGDIYDITIYNNELYAVGAFLSAGGIQAEHIAKWDGTEWCALGSTFNSNILSVQFYEDTLLIGGGFTLVDGDQIKAIAKWIGGDFIDTCGAIIGITEYNDPSLRLYPNPGTSNILIEIQFEGEVRYSIRDILGSVIQTGTFSEKKEIDISQFSSGLYTLQLQTPKGFITEKFLKE